MNQDSIQDSIKQLAANKQKLQFGVFDGLINNTSTQQWDQSNQLLSPRRWHRKSWIFVGAYHPSIYVGFAIVDAGFLAKAFCYVYFPSTGKLIEHGIDRPFAFSKDFEANFNDSWKLGNYRINNSNEQLSFSYASKKFSLSIKGKNTKQGLSFICPSIGTKRPFHFTYKNQLISFDIRCEINGKKLQFKTIPGSIDFSKGYPPKHTQWNWTSFMGQLEDGTPLGINVVDGFNNNMENVVWLGTERILIGPVCYQYKQPLEHSLWKVDALDGNLSLSMQGIGNRKEHINLRFLKSKFVQVFGSIQGRIRYQGNWKKFSGQGVMEEHEAIW
jgi:hypothetical protein